ncbi:MAG: type II secretion system F family protein [Pseudomonadota bacterium]
MLRVYWVPIVFGLAACIAAIGKWLSVEQGQRTIDRLKLTVPGIKQIFVEVYFIQSLKVMSMSLANGVTVVDTLAGTKDVVKNHLIRQFFAQTEEAVHQGKGLAHGFQSSPLVPDLVKQMVTTGEESGNLPHVMGRLASYYERELTKRLTMLSKIAEPLMLLLMGLVVGVLVSSLILPIFKLSKAVT